jgi:hypothetical protein
MPSLNATPVKTRSGTISHPRRSQKIGDLSYDETGQFFLKNDKFKMVLLRGNGGSSLISADCSRLHEDAHVFKLADIDWGVRMDDLAAACEEMLFVTVKEEDLGETEADSAKGLLLLQYGEQEKNAEDTSHGLNWLERYKADEAKKGKLSYF